MVPTVCYTEGGFISRPLLHVCYAESVVEALLSMDISQNMSERSSLLFRAAQLPYGDIFLTSAPVVTYASSPTRMLSDGYSVMQ